MYLLATATSVNDSNHHPLQPHMVNACAPVCPFMRCFSQSDNCSSYEVYQRANSSEMVSSTVPTFRIWLIHLPAKSHQS